MQGLFEDLKGSEAETFRPLLSFLQAKKLSKGTPPYVPRWELMSLQKQCQLALLWKEAGFLERAGRLWGWLSPLKSFPCLWCPESEFDEEKIRNAFTELGCFEEISGWKPECDLTLLQWGDAKAALTLDGRGTSLGMIQCGIEVRAFGPQAENGSFGIEGRGMNQWTRVFAYKDIWLEMKSEIKDGGLVPSHKNFQRGLRPDFSAQQSAEVDGNLHQVVETEREAGLEKMGQNPKNFCGRVLELKFNFAGITPEKPCSLAFYIKAQSCEVGKEILRPKSLKRFLGDVQAVQFEKKTTIQSKEPHKTEVIPLAGERCFWGAEFLLKYSMNPFSPTLTLQILNSSSLIAK